MTDLLVWNAEYCIGEDTIDAEHQNLFHLANAVFKVKLSESKIDNIGPLIHKLYEYMKYHFDHEEEFMDAIGFTEADFHKTKHSEIIAEMNAMLKSSHQISVLADKLAAMMVKWVLKHILEEDIKIKPYLR